MTEREVNDSAKKVSLEILGYYDTKIKEWVMKNIPPSSDGKVLVVFGSLASFPSPGDKDVLYIDGDNFYRWDPATKQYIKIGASTGGSGAWGDPF